jgi:hypothetical protein
MKLSNTPKSGARWLRPHNCILQCGRGKPRPLLRRSQALTEGLLSIGGNHKVRDMGLPSQPVALTPEQVAVLSRKLSDLRHNVNNNLALMVAALELIRRKPDSVPRMITNLTEQPQKILEEIKKFADEFEKTLKITPD